MTTTEMLGWIKQHAELVGYTLGFQKDGSDLEIYLNYVHGVAYYVQVNGERIQIYQYQGRTELAEDSYQKHSIYSIRDVTDLVDFCNILSCSNRIRAGRHEE